MSLEALNAVLRDAGVSKTIYALVLPETVAAVDRVLDDRAAFHAMYTEAWTQKQDPVHEDFLDAWVEWSRPVVDLDPDLRFRYATQGAGEAIKEAIYMHGLRARQEGFTPRIHVFAGEYEGYAALARAAGIEIVAHDRARWEEALPAVGARDQFYLSQPSSIDGNVWGDYPRFVAALAGRAPGCELMLDLTYVGCVPREFRVGARHPNIAAVFFSLSKPMGVYYHRIGGLLSRREYPGLFGTKWFKNLFSLRLGTELLRSHDVRELPRRYAPLQARAAAAVAAALGLELRPSDVFLLAAAPVREPPSDLERYLTRSAGGHSLVRCCLTPTMSRLIDPAVDGTVKARWYERLPDAR